MLPVGVAARSASPSIDPAAAPSNLAPARTTWGTRSTWPQSEENGTMTDGPDRRHRWLLNVRFGGDAAWAGLPPWWRKTHPGTYHRNGPPW